MIHTNLDTIEAVTASEGRKVDHIACKGGKLMTKIQFASEDFKIAAIVPYTGGELEVQPVPQLEYGLPKIPWDHPKGGAVQCYNYFAAVYRKLQSEAFSWWHWDKTEKCYYMVVPAFYYASGGSLHYDVSTKFCKRCQVGLMDGHDHCPHCGDQEDIQDLNILGTSHSHGTMAPFHSATDHANELDTTGFHITFGHLDKGPIMNVAGSFVVADARHRFNTDWTTHFGFEQDMAYLVRNDGSTIVQVVHGTQRSCEAALEALKDAGVDVGNYSIITDGLYNWRMALWLDLVASSSSMKGSYYVEDSKGRKVFAGAEETCKRWVANIISASPEGAEKKDEYSVKKEPISYKGGYYGSDYKGYNGSYKYSSGKTPYKHEYKSTKAPSKKADDYELPHVTPANCDGDLGKAFMRLLDMAPDYIFLPACAYIYLGLASEFYGHGYDEISSLLDGVAPTDFQVEEIERLKLPGKSQDKWHVVVIDKGLEACNGDLCTTHMSWLVEMILSRIDESDASQRLINVYEEAFNTCEDILYTAIRNDPSWEDADDDDDDGEIVITSRGSSTKDDDDDTEWEDRTDQFPLLDVEDELRQYYQDSWGNPELWK